MGYSAEEEPGGVPGLHGRPFAEDTQATIDAEVARILRDAEQRAEAFITEHREVFDQLVERLLDEELVDGADIYALLGRDVPRP